MSERAFWRFFWIAAIRIPWSFRKQDGVAFALTLMWHGTTRLLVARYLG